MISTRDARVHYFTVSVFVLEVPLYTAVHACHSHITLVHGLCIICCVLELFAGSRMAHTATALSPLLTVPISLDLLKDTVNQV